MDKAISKKGKRDFEKVIRKLEVEKVITELDKLAIDNLRKLHHYALICEEDIERNGIVTPNGKVNEHIRIYITLTTNIFKILKEFGLTAKSRRYIVELSPEAKRTELEKFFGMEGESMLIEAQVDVLRDNHHDND